MRQLLLLLCLTLPACNMVVDSGPPDIQSLKESRPVGTAKDLDVKVRYDVGSFEVRSDLGDNLFSVNLDYDARRSKPNFDFTAGDHATMSLLMDEPHMAFNHGGRESNDLALRLNPLVPMSLDFTTGVSDSHLDLTGLSITTLHLRGGVGRTEVSFDKPIDQSMHSFDVESGVGNLIIRGLGNVRVERLKVDGGVGRTELDFTGGLKDAQINAEINVGVGQVRLLLPREAGITLEGEGSFLSNISAPSFEKNGHTYSHRAADGAPAHVFIRVRSGVGGVTVELI